MPDYMNSYLLDTMLPTIKRITLRRMQHNGLEHTQETLLAHTLLTIRRIMLSYINVNGLVLIQETL